MAVILSAFAAPLAAQTPAPAPATPAAAPQQLPADSLERARKWVNWIWSSQIDSLISVQPPEANTPETRQRMTDDIARMASRAGTEVSVVEERWIRRNGIRQYWRVSRFSDFTDEPVVLRLAMSPTGQMVGVGFNPLSRVPPIDP